MRCLRPLPLIFLLLTRVGSAQPAQQVLELDAARSRATFEVKVLYLIGLHGEFGSVHGTLAADDAPAVVMSGARAFAWLAAAALLLAGCAVDPLHARRAAATAAAAQDHVLACAAADACAIASPFTELASRARAENTHYVNLLERGE